MRIATSPSKIPKAKSEVSDPALHLLTHKL